jgi:hypothetical protein
MSGSRARLGSLVSLPFTVAAVVFAPPPITSLPGPGGPGPHSRRLPPISSPLFALAAGRAVAMPSMLACDHRKGGRVLRPRSPPPAAAEGVRVGGHAPSRLAPCWPWY